MKMVRSAIDDVKIPTSNLAVLADRGLHDASLVLVQATSIRRHRRFCFEFANWIRTLFSMIVPNPATLISRQPGPVSRPSEKNPSGPGIGGSLGREFIRSLHAD